MRKRGRLSQTAQQYYIIGVLDGWDNLGTITLSAEQQPPLGTGFTKQIECTVGMASVQINAIIQKYMENNPSCGITTWHCWYGQSLMRCVHQQANDTEKPALLHKIGSLMHSVEWI